MTSMMTKFPLAQEAPLEAAEGPRLLASPASYTHLTLPTIYSVYISFFAARFTHQSTHIPNFVFDIH